MSHLPKPDYARNMRLIGHSDQGGRPDGVQLMVHRGFAYVGHMFYASALLDGFTDYIFITIDMSDPTAPREVGRWWIPAMNLAAGETPSWEAAQRYGLHHAIVDGNTAYAAWRDAGMVVLDIADRAKPTPIVHRNWSPPFGGGTHNCLPLADRDLLVVLDEAVLDHQEDGLKLIWVFDNRVPTNPISIATMPTPAEADYKTKGGHFGPHNIHENRPGSLVSSKLIFATYQNAGIRVFDISNPFAPKEIGALVPPQPTRLADTRPNRARVIQSADVFVDAAGLIYATDYNAGLYIMELS